MNLIKRYCLIRVKLIALYKQLMTKTTLTYISTNRTINIVVYRYRLANHNYRDKRKKEIDSRQKDMQRYVLCYANRGRVGQFLNKGKSVPPPWCPATKRRR